MLADSSNIYMVGNSALSPFLARTLMGSLMRGKVCLDRVPDLVTGTVTLSSTTLLDSPTLR